ncbi:MAG TPA: bifunctional glutamate N-acetyltransferase/amino-acid acetyltransferase ArgJ [Actinobacteria bacterium]|nr:bifunctional glutamate N-acetyltransferase/amino-acid acetyltransferase ArgJ [Actinomycetota bacterium]
MSVVGPAGFVAAGVACGIKPTGDPDLALVVAAEAAVTAAAFTTNRAAAAPVVVSRRHRAAAPRSRAVVVNSGCANAGTGPRGLEDARTMAEATAEAVGCAPEEVLVCSTGPIGAYLPIEAVRAGIAAAAEVLGDDEEAGDAAARAIMTTDTVPKTTVVEADGFVVGGMAKGAGMVRPDMATMLAVLTTDAVVDDEVLAEAFTGAVDRSFHALDLDGCPSTNDAVILLASGASGHRPSPLELAGAVTTAAVHLVEQLAADAEGAERVVVMEITGAADDVEAREAGRAMADSALVRAAFHGGDPNWGRLLGALGATSIDFEPERFSVWFEGVQVAAEGRPAEFDEAALVERLAEGDFELRVDLGVGTGRAVVFTTDLTPDYVRFNAERS